MCSCRVLLEISISKVGISQFFEKWFQYVISVSLSINRVIKKCLYNSVTIHCTRHSEKLYGWLQYLLFCDETYPFKWNQASSENKIPYSCKACEARAEHSLTAATSPAIPATGGEKLTVGHHENIVGFIKALRIKWLGNIERMSEERMPKMILNSTIDGGRKRYRPRKRGIDDLESDLRSLGIRNKKTKAGNRNDWKVVVKHGCARVAHCVTARCRNFSHYCRPLRH